MRIVIVVLAFLNFFEDEHDDEDDWKMTRFRPATK